VNRIAACVASVGLLACAHLTPDHNDGLTAPPRTNAAIVLSVLDMQAPRVLAVAEAMPEDRYAFVPTNGTFTSVRSFSSQLKHIAADLYLDGGAILGELAPSAIRYYEAAGLTLPPRRIGGKRAYDSSVFEAIALITLVQDAGFTDALRQAL